MTSLTDICESLKLNQQCGDLVINHMVEFFNITEFDKYRSRFEINARGVYFHPSFNYLYHCHIGYLYCIKTALGTFLNIRVGDCRKDAYDFLD